MHPFIEPDAVSANREMVQQSELIDRCMHHTALADL